MTIEIPTCIRTLRLKVKTEAYPWLNAAAIEVNHVWNWANATSDKAARPFAGPGRWLSAYDLDQLSAGASEGFARIGADTIQRVNAEFARRRKQFKKSILRWRASSGSLRALGWVPFKACDAFKSSARETQREPAAAADPSRDLQVWPCSLSGLGVARSVVTLMTERVFFFSSADEPGI